MEQSDRRAKSLIAGGACLLLIIAIIVPATSRNADRQYDGQAIACDEIGNPLSRRGYTWCAAEALDVAIVEKRFILGDTRFSSKY